MCFSSIKTNLGSLVSKCRNMRQNQTRRIFNVQVDSHCNLQFWFWLITCISMYRQPGKKADMKVNILSFPSRHDSISLGVLLFMLCIQNIDILHKPQGQKYRGKSCHFDPHPLYVVPSERTTGVFGIV